MNYEKLSRELAYALRHNPAKYDLQLDNEGWVESSKLLKALQSQKRWESVTAIDLRNVVDADPKGRYALVEGKIRAVHGHSRQHSIDHIAQEPPEVLYHGTTTSAKDPILAEGLKPQSRQYVHLSTTVETATNVGKRRDSNPVLLRVEAKKAFNNGINFYKSQSDIWLADHIPPKYLSET